MIRIVRLPFLVPMFDDRSTVLGVPGPLIVLAAAVIGSVVGIAWLRRIGGIEPEPRSFRATHGRRTPFATSLAGAIVISGGVLLALLAVAWLLRPG
jgi:hypothetical protein